MAEAKEAWETSHDPVKRAAAWQLLCQLDGAAFLLSIAGMFDSEATDTSENVQQIVADFVRQKCTEDSA